MRGLYSHASTRMRQELKQALQARWEESLQARFEPNSYSPVPALDELLTPVRAKMGTAGNLRPQICPTSDSNTAPAAT
jgi:hypothetical protein